MIVTLLILSTELPAKKLQHQYKDFLCNFKILNQNRMQNNGLFFPKNLDKCFSIDKTSLSNGELYVFIPMHNN